VLTAAEMQLECGEGVNDCLFVTIKATLDENGAPLVDAWQVRLHVSKTCDRPSDQICGRRFRSKV
jgi:hypothetical protein